MKLMGTRSTHLPIYWRISGRRPWHRSWTSLAVPSAGPALALLKALGWSVGISSPAQFDRGRLEQVLTGFLGSDDPDTREAAARAMRWLPKDRADYWLDRHRMDEKDASVLETIEEELSRQPSAGC